MLQSKRFGCTIAHLFSFLSLISCGVQCGNQETQESERLSNFSMAVVRPFFGGDALDLVESFSRWEVLPPCKLDAAGVPVMREFPVDLTLYFARDIDAPENAAIKKLMGPIVDNSVRKGQDRSWAWRKCFKAVTLLGVSFGNRCIHVVIQS